MLKRRSARMRKSTANINFAISSDDGDSDDPEMPKSKSKKDDKGTLKSKTPIDQQRTGVQKPPSATNGASTSVTSPRTTPVLPIGSTSFFSMVTCLWEVNTPSIAPGRIICKRKLTRDECTEHVRNHHIQKLENVGGPYICSWQGCTGHEFDAVEGLKEHIVIHVNGSGMFPITQPPVSKPPQAPVPVAKTVKTVVEAPKKDSGDTWYISALHAMLASYTLPYSGALCPETCYFCRFFSLRNRSGPSMPEELYEFTKLIEKFEAYENDPIKFLENFLFVANAHESTYHKTATLDEYFWLEAICDSDLKCEKHTNSSLVNFFYTRYKSCKVCSKNAKMWPVNKRNLILGLDKSTQMKVEDIVCVKAHVFQLASMVSLGDDGYFRTHVQHGGKWKTYSRDGSQDIRAQNVLNDKGACIVMYTAKEFYDVHPEPQSNCKSYSLNTFDELVVQSEEPVADPHVGTDMEVTHDPIAPPPFSPEAEKENHQICKRDGSDFNSQFCNRILANKGHDSSINSVLQALLTTSLPLTVKRMCAIDKRCHFCYMLSFSHRVFSNTSKDPLLAYEFSLRKGLIGLKSDAEVDPRIIIKNLIQRIINDEYSNHGSNDVKYKFMIRFQKSCSCMESCEEYLWTISPPKNNESLGDLMSKFSLRCDKCCVSIPTEPVQMPEHLIVSVACPDLHYPDEFRIYNARYFLAAIIAPVDDKDSSYFVRCRIFGKWVQFGDKQCSFPSSGDVLFMKRVYILLYVTSEVSSTDIMNIAHTAPFKVNMKIDPFSVKQERM